MTSPVIKRIQIKDKEYEGMIELRDEVLRRPLGLSIKDDDHLNKDVTDILLVAMHEEKVIGCVILKPLNTEQAKLRAMAVAPSWQGRGIGSLLVESAEHTAVAGDFHVMELHARITARPFYEKLGYTATGSPFTEVTIPHIRMEKQLI